MKVLISDKLSQEGIDVLNNVDGIQMIYKTNLEPEDLKNEIRDVEALIVRSSTQVTREVLSEANNLKIIGRAGIGIDNIDCSAATERGVIVINTPSGNATTTAEHTIAMLMSLSRHIPQADKSMIREPGKNQNLPVRRLREKYWVYSGSAILVRLLPTARWASE